jgi:hypothetical protein
VIVKSRPQVIDAQGRNWTPKTLALSKSELAAAAAGIASGKTRSSSGALAASSASAASDGDMGGDTHSAGGFTHSVSSDIESAGAGATGVAIDGGGSLTRRFKECSEGNCHHAMRCPPHR